MQAVRGPQAGHMHPDAKDNPLQQEKKPDLLFGFATQKKLNFNNI